MIQDQPITVILFTDTQESDSVTNRVAGFVCKFVFAEHMSCVTSMVVIGKEHGMDTTYLVCTTCLRGETSRALSLYLSLYNSSAGLEKQGLIFIPKSVQLVSTIR